MIIKLHKVRYRRPVLDVDLGGLRLFKPLPRSATFRRLVTARYTDGLFGYPVRHPNPSIVVLPDLVKPLDRYCPCTSCHGRGSDFWGLRPCETCKGVGSLPLPLPSGCPF